MMPYGPGRRQKPYVGGVLLEGAYEFGDGIVSI